MIIQPGPLQTPQVGTLNRGLWGSPPNPNGGLPIPTDPPARLHGWRITNEFSEGILSEPPPTKKVAGYCSVLGSSVTARKELRKTDAFTKRLGLPLAALAAHNQANADFFRQCFLIVSVASGYNRKYAEAQWDDFCSVVAGEYLDESAWIPLQRFARRHGYVDDPATPIRATSLVTSEGNVDPLRFEVLPIEVAIARINVVFFVHTRTGKIYCQGPDGELKALSKQDFKTALGGRSVEITLPNGKLQRRSAADAWLDSSDRREVMGMQYCPNSIGLKPFHLNLCKRFGDIDPASGSCAIVLDHIRDIIADGNDLKAEFCLDWFAHILQFPMQKPGVAIFLIGLQGTGKSLLGLILRRLLGFANVYITSEKDRLFGRFNASIANKILIIGEEVFFVGDKLIKDRLKHLITGGTIQIEFKFGDCLEFESYHRLLLTSNHNHVIQAEGEERRFVTFDVSDRKRGDTDYFERLYAIAEGRDDSTAAAFMQYLLTRDLSNFKPWKAQQAFSDDAGLIRQKILSLSPPLAWLREVMDECVDQLQPNETVHWSDGVPIAYGSGDKSCKWPARFARRDAVDAFRAWAAKSRPHDAAYFTGSKEKFWAEIHRVIPPANTSTKDPIGSRQVTIDLPDLQANFDRYFKGQPI
jgi:hypothetical protein